MEILPLSPGETITTPLSIDSHQYYLADPDTMSDYGRGTELLDGVIGPQPHLIQIATGVPTGLISVTLHAFAPAEQVADDQVGAESDLDLTSGNFVLTSMGEKKITIGWNDVRQLRMRVIVRDRDAATTFSAQERHEIWVWPVDSRRPRWRSTAIDRIGAALTVTTTHLGTLR